MSIEKDINKLNEAIQTLKEYCIGNSCNSDCLCIYEGKCSFLYKYPDTFKTIDKKDHLNL